MLNSAPNEQESLPPVAKFLGDALDGKITMCAHNASFDFGFLSSLHFLDLGMMLKLSMLIR